MKPIRERMGSERWINLKDGVNHLRQKKKGVVFVPPKDKTAFSIHLECHNEIHIIRVYPGGDTVFHNHEMSDMRGQLVIDRLSHHDIAKSKLKGCYAIYRALQEHYINSENKYNCGDNIDHQVWSYLMQIFSLRASKRATVKKLLAEMSAGDPYARPFSARVTEMIGKEVSDYLTEHTDYRGRSEKDYKTGKRMKTQDDITFYVKFSENNLPIQVEQDKSKDVEYKLSLPLSWYSQVWKTRKAVCEGMLVTAIHKVCENGLIAASVLKQGYGFKLDHALGMLDFERNKVSFITQQRLDEIMEGAKPRRRRTKEEMAAAQASNPSVNPTTTTP